MWLLTRWQTLRGFRGDKSIFAARSTPGMKKTASERQKTLERQYGARNFHCRFGNGILNWLYWNWYRRLHFFLCFYDNEIEVDLDDLLSNPFNSQPPSLNDLQRLTGFQKTWLIFIYRNFKQICPNGRMTRTQWRAIFRFVFKGAADYEFADRIFLAISGNRSNKMLTFEDLIMCLYDLTQSFRNDLDTQNSSVPSTTTAQFAFSLMQPDAQGKVDEEAFISYTKAIFDLNSSISINSSGDAATFGMLSGSNSSKDDKNARRATVYPWLNNLARSQFRQLDKDEDGYIVLADIQELFDQRGFLYESLVLKTESEIARQSESGSST